MKFWSNTDLVWFEKRVKDKFYNIKEIDRKSNLIVWNFKLDNCIYDFYIEFHNIVNEFKIVCAFKGLKLYEFDMVVGFDKKENKTTFEIIKAIKYRNNRDEHKKRILKADKYLKEYKEIGNIAVCFIKCNYCKI